MLSHHQLAQTVTSPEARLSAVATALYGDEWARPVARLTEIALRTCQRVQASIREGRSDERASSVLAALSSRLSVMGAACSGAETTLFYRTALSLEDYDDATRSFVSQLRARIESPDYDYADAEREYRAVSLWDADLAQLLNESASLEDYLWRLLQSSAAIQHDGASEDDYTAFSNAVYYAADELDVSVAQDLDGLWHFYGPPAPRYVPAGSLGGTPVTARPVLAFLIPDEAFGVSVIQELEKDPSVRRAYSAIDYKNIDDGQWKKDHFAVIVELAENASPAIRERLEGRIAWWQRAARVVE